MRDITQFVRLIKQTALDAVKASNPSEIRYGTVIKEKPLEIRIDQKIVLNDSHLILTRNVTEHEIEATVDFYTEKRAGGTLYEAYELHDHHISGRKKFLIHNGLKNGEKVLLIREQGGKKYIVIDRV